MSAKSYELTFEDRGAYTYACVQAEVINLTIAVQYINEMISHLRQVGAKKLLFVRETPMMMSSREYSIIGSFIINVLPRDVRVALVDRSPSHRIVVEFINAEAKEKSRDLRAFEIFEEAEAWLLADD